MALFRWIGLCLLAMMLLPATAGALEVRFLPKAQVDGQQITLGEIASFEPESAGQKLAGVRLFEAPQGGEIEVHKAATLKAYVLDAVPSGTSISWSGSETVAVHRHGRLIKGEDVAKLVESYLQDQEEKLTATHLDFSPENLPDPFTVEQGELTHKVIPSNEDVVGSRYFIVRFRLDGRLVRNVNVRGELDATAPVVTAARDLDRGTRLGKGDLELREKDITRSGEVFTSVDEAAGKRVKRGIDSGDIVERRKVARPILVKRGEVVTMEASKGSMLITAKGVARSKGKEGETIKVRNTGSQKEILCEVVGSGRVQVEF